MHYLAQRLAEYASASTVLDDLDEMVNPAMWVEEMRKFAGVELAELIELAEARRALVMSRRSNRGNPQPGPTIAETAAANLKRLRTLCEYTQDELADDMRKLGFLTWTRATVADAEWMPKPAVDSQGRRKPRKPKRALSIEELVGLAILFQTSVGVLMGDADDMTEGIRLNDLLTIDRAAYLDLLHGGRPQKSVHHGDEDLSRNDFNATAGSNRVTGRGRWYDAESDDQPMTLPADRFYQRRGGTHGFTSIEPGEAAFETEEDKL